MAYYDSLEVNREISPSDEMCVSGDEAHYFRVGASALECIDSALRAAHLEATEVQRILDMPCGYGRVLRYLKSAFPRSEIVACDLNREGVDFCARTFGDVPIYSDENPAKLDLGSESFDLIWAGSLLTHLDTPLWDGMLELWRRSLRAGGILVFTTAGRHVYDLVARGRRTQGLPSWRYSLYRHDYERHGFGYANYWDRSYGASLSNPPWVFDRISRLDDLRIVFFSEKAWDKNQDVYACIRDPGWLANQSSTPTTTFLRDKLMELRTQVRLRDRLRSRSKITFTKHDLLQYYQYGKFRDDFQYPPKIRRARSLAP
jgi:SAM-dependent methyltransferase